MKRLVPLAAALVAACLTTPPPHPRALEANELCTQYISNGDLTRAEVQCDLGLQFSPQYADLWVNKGLIALRRGQDDKAKEHFIKALRYNNEQAQAYNNLGFVYFKEQSYGKAHDNFQRALKVNPDYVEARYNLALTFKGMKENDKAKKELRTIIAINDQIADAHAQLCAILHEENALDEAVQECTAAVTLDPKFDDAWLELCNTYGDAGKHAEARDACASCIEADPENAACRNNLPIYERKAALSDKGLQELKDNAAGKNTPEAMYAVALGYKEKGLRNEEERQYKKCLKLDPKFALCHFGMFEITHEERRDKDATVACKNFLKFAEHDEFRKQVAACEKFLETGAY